MITLFEGFHEKYGKGYYTIIESRSGPCVCWHFGDKESALKSFKKTNDFTSREPTLVPRQKARIFNSIETEESTCTNLSGLFYG